MTVLGWVFVYVFLSALDIITTVIGLSQGHQELNPIFAAIFVGAGTLGVVLVKWALVNVLVVLVASVWDRQGARTLAYIGTAVLAFTVLNNIVVIVG